MTKIVTDKSDPDYRPWRDPTYPALSAADFPDEQQATIDALVAALEAAVVAKEYDGMWPDKQIDAALALARGGK